MDFEHNLQPPLHIPIAFGSVTAKKSQQVDLSLEQGKIFKCFLCKGSIKVGVCAGHLVLNTYVFKHKARFGYRMVDKMFLVN